MEPETTMHLWALREVNLAMLDGLKLALITMKTWDDTEQVQRESIIGSLEQLVAQTETIYQSGDYRQ